MVTLYKTYYNKSIKPRRRSVMRRKGLWVWSGWVMVLLLFLCFNVEAKKKMELVGRETPNFTLPSTEDRLINYAEEYYGKYHLIITFFPAAFTPI